MSDYILGQQTTEKFEKSTKYYLNKVNAQYRFSTYEMKTFWFEPQTKLQRRIMQIALLSNSFWWNHTLHCATYL